LRRIRIGMGQTDPTVGDLAGNTAEIIRCIEEARSLGVDLLTFPELAITGYPPEVLLLKPQFIKQTQLSLAEIVEHSSDMVVVVGFVDGGDNGDIYNAAAIVYEKKLAGVYHKISLPCYGVFDESRYFRAGSGCPIFSIGGVGIGVAIGGDIHGTEPVIAQACAEAQVLVNATAFPYHVENGCSIEGMLAARARQNSVAIAYNNLVGGQDELIFDGGSLIINREGEIVARGRQFERDLIVADLEVVEKHQSQAVVLTVSEEFPALAKPALPAKPREQLDNVGEIYSALVLGTRDYVRKNGFEKVVIGLSGGVDSSLVATIAVDALGPGNVVGVSMPSRYTSSSSKSDSEAVGKNLGIEFKVIPIEKAFGSYLEMLSESFKGTVPGVTEENIQARIRGNILFALSNKFGWLVLACSNKSEASTGYTTLYGDMAGGFIPLKDVPKTMVFELAQHRNREARREVIPLSVLARVPSAELRANQKDTDTLPPYELLDPILEAYVEDDLSIAEIVGRGFEREVVVKVARLVDKNEYKRRQAAPGIKITTRNFGQGRRLPVTNRFEEQVNTF